MTRRARPEDAIRPAGMDDLATLAGLERAASTAALSHVFAADIPFPEDDVVARWAIVLGDPAVTVLLDEAGGAPAGYAAYGDGWLRHFGVAPRWWGTGRARRLHAAALAGLAAQGVQTTYLWVLVDNHRARAFYVREGWAETGVREPEAFAPYPMKMQMTRRL